MRRPVVANRSPHFAPHQRLVRRVAGDEVLHVEPTTEANAAQQQRLAVRSEKPDPEVRSPAYQYSYRLATSKISKLKGNFSIST
jgi:hypothetical protein